MNGWTAPEIRSAFLDYMDELVTRKIPYIFGGKDPNQPTPPGTDAGLDCSGAYCWCLTQCGLAPEGYGHLHNAASLHSRFEVTDAPDPADAAFYGSNGIVDHIMAVVGDGRVVGASGGGAHCTTLADARRLGAAIHYRDSVNYRPDFIGYGKLPLIKTAVDDPQPEEIT